MTTLMLSTSASSRGQVISKSSRIEAWESAISWPLRVVFRDAGFVSDSVKITVEQAFKLLSPVTEIETL